ncbi:MAG: S8 family serine peptidase, partial [Chloroflexota bacterium]
MNGSRLIRFVLGITAVFALILITNYTPPSLAATGPSLLTDELRQEVQKYGEIPIIIALDVPAHRAWQESGSSSTPDLARIEQVSQAIARTADQLLDRLSGANISQIKRYEYFPLLAMIVDEAALEALAADKTIIDIGLDIAVPPAMDDTIPLIGANNNHFLNYTGSGWSVAILDTGVDKNHPALFGKVISEACYSSNVPAQGATSLCPGGATSSTATNSGLHCATGISGCDHGTHVAGIAARVAPDARLIPIQVFSRFSDSGSNTPCQNVNRTSPCTLSFTSDQVSALNRVWALHISGNNINVASANMSLGGGFHTGPCDHLSQYNGLRLAINQLRDQNVATVIASGNSNYRNAMAAPACLTPAISVAASDKSDQVASFSNISVYTTLIAPGTPIL